MTKAKLFFQWLGILLTCLPGSSAFAELFPMWNCECLCDGKLTIGADWLYWKVTEDNLTLVDVSEVTFTENQPVLVNNTPVDQHFKFDSGFRAGIGYELPGGCWDIGVIYTYLPSHSSSSHFELDPLSSGINSNIVDFPILLAFADDDRLQTPTSIGTKWNLSANTVDVDLGRTVCFCDCVKIRPHVGFRVLWFDQKFRSKALSYVSTSIPAIAYDVKLSEKYTGCGVEAGLWGAWDVGCGLSIIGHFGGSILYGKYRNHQKAIAVELSPSPELLVSDKIGSSFRNGTPTVDYFLGLQYETCFYSDMTFSVHAGWEQHIWFDVNRLAKEGNLSAQGLTLGAQLGF